MVVALRMTVLAVIGVLAVPAFAAAQESGSISGTVTESESRTPVAGARVAVVAIPSKRVILAARTGDNGRYAIARVPAGSYTVDVSLVGYAPSRVDTVAVMDGQLARLDIELARAPTILQRVQTTESGVPEEVRKASSHVAIIDKRQLNERPVGSIVEQLGFTPGVDISRGGITQTNVVARGFNNAFSGSLLMLQDNRFAAVPSLRVNIPALLPATNEDIDHVELVLGPGAALYGPNAAAGVLHVITKSPFDSQATTLTVDGGERSVMRLGARYADVVGRRVGFKLSGEYSRGNDWEYRDVAEPATFPATPSTPLERVGKPNARDFDLERYGGEARIDLRLPDRSEIITSYGLAHIVNGLELTGANGTAQVRDWTMQHLQMRYRKDKFFAQVFGNLSNAGNADAQDLNGTFLLRTGQPIVDKSRLFAAQVRQGFDVGRRQSFLVGGEYVFTNPRTDSTINGRNEEDDNTAEVGGYLHSTTHLSQKLDLVSALRVDVNSRLDGRFYSPRAALVYKLSGLQTLRAAYNRAYSTPTNFNLYLDLLQGSLRPSTGLPYDIRAIGVPEDGFHFRRDCAGGLGGLCMISPFPYANGAVDANAFTGAIGYQNALAVAIGRGLRGSISGGIRQASPSTSQAQADALADAAITRLRALNPTSAQVGSNLRLFNPSNPAQAFATPYSPDSVVDVAPLKASFVNNYELGYNGIIAKRVSLAVDGWYQRRENFVTAALNFTPTVFLGSAQTAGYIQPELQQALQQALQAGGMPQPQAQATANALAAGLSPSIAGGLAQVPTGNVVPDSRLTRNGDFAFTYRNIDQTIDLYGTDIGVGVQFTTRFSMAATYSWVSDVEFPEVQNGGAPLSINAPDQKASLTTRWADDVKGYSADLRGRYMNAFTVNSGVFFGEVPVNAFVDASFSWRLPFGDRRTTWGVNATNVLDNRRASFAGVPAIGRLVMTRVQYTF